LSTSFGSKRALSARESATSASGAREHVAPALGLVWRALAQRASTARARGALGRFE
jgi:hypothetical protein